MVDRKNLVYEDDGGKRWLVPYRASYLTDLGFDVWDGIEDLEEFPPGSEMRKARMVHVDESPAMTPRSRTFYVGTVDNQYYTDPTKTFTYKAVGIDSGGMTGDITFKYMVVSTTGELVQFVTEPDPGHKVLVASDYITMVEPTM